MAGGRCFVCFRFMIPRRCRWVDDMLPLRGDAVHVFICTIYPEAILPTRGVAAYPRRCCWVDGMLPLRGDAYHMGWLPKALATAWAGYPRRCRCGNFELFVEQHILPTVTERCKFYEPVIHTFSGISLGDNVNLLYQLL